MNYKLTQKSQEALAAAIRQATTDGSPQTEPLHLLNALLDQAEGITRPLLKEVGVDPDRLKDKVESAIGALPKVAGSTVSSPSSSRQLIVSINTAAQRAQQMEDEFVSTEHLLVGLAADGGEASRLLKDAGATPEGLLEAFEQVRGTGRVTSENPEDTYQSLEKFGVDLTERAREGKVDPVIGRDGEIRRVIQVLSRRTKN
ncbi:MAG TPA: ATP-dependent chaperone ClpB, partial [Nocardiopsis listeri]|uniref:Clp protease N-terminal domain-containing protein n=1 Tax=Nocardiopsis listeri TaxID=53440 RepID=UPI001DB1CE12